MQYPREHGPFLFIFGTRPEAIKLCPVFLELQRRGVPYVAVNTGQHRDMVAPVLRYFGCQATETLTVMQPDQTPLSLVRALLAALPDVLLTYRPRLVVVHGDTASAYAGMLCAYLSGIPVAHIEAGLRTGDVHAPYPEEYFRRAIDAASDWFYAPTEAAVRTLLREGRDRSRIVLCGNTATDAVRLCLQDAPREAAAILDGLPKPDGAPLRGELIRGKRLLLLTLHRRELDDDALRSLLEAVRRGIRGREDVCLLFPVHPSPRVRHAALTVFADQEQIQLLEPLPLPHMQQLLAHTTLLLTDSGGLQEEATYLGIPTLVLRERTEREEGVAAGVLRLIGTTPDVVADALAHLLDDETARPAMARASTVFGDGYAARRIVSHLCALMTQ